MLIKEMRKLYRSPITSQAHSRLECTGGADCNHYDVPGAYMTAIAPGRVAFPTLIQLARVLRQVKPELSLKQSRRWAHGMCFLNDIGDFNGAWTMLAMFMNEEM